MTQGDAVSIGIDLPGKDLGEFAVRRGTRLIASGLIPSWASHATRWAWFDARLFMADPAHPVYEWKDQAWQKVMSS